MPRSARPRSCQRRIVLATRSTCRRRPSSRMRWISGSIVATCSTSAQMHAVGPVDLEVPPVRPIERLVGVELGVGRRRRHRVADLLADVAHDGQEDVLLGREVRVEAPVRQLRRGRDVGDTGVEIAVALEDATGGCEQLVARAQPLRRGPLAVSCPARRRGPGRRPAATRPALLRRSRRARCVSTFMSNITGGADVRKELHG